MALRFRRPPTTEGHHHDPTDHRSRVRRRGGGGANQLAWQTSAPYLVPGKGVITQLRVSAGTAGATMSIKVVRPSTTSIVYTTAPRTVVNANDVVTVNVRVAVEAGDALGFWLGSDAIGCMTPTGPADTYAGVSGSPDQPAGPVAGSLSTGSGGRLAIGGRFEADADGDGYGDDS